MKAPLTLITVTLEEKKMLQFYPGWRKKIFMWVYYVKAFIHDGNISTVNQIKFYERKMTES